MSFSILSNSRKLYQTTTGKSLFSPTHQKNWISKSQITQASSRSSSKLIFARNLSSSHPKRSSGMYSASELNELKLNQHNTHGRLNLITHSNNFTINTFQTLEPNLFVKRASEKNMHSQIIITELSTLLVVYCINEQFQAEDWSQWRGIVTSFIPVGLCLVGVMQWRAYRKRSGDRIAEKWEIDCYCMLPLRTVSRCWGWLADKQLPEFVRPFVYRLYANSFGVNLSEALHEDLRSYPSLADFFARPLKDGVRKIDGDSALVSPCDGTVLHFGTVHTGEVEQVKGVTYSLEKFLGENCWNNNNQSLNDYRAGLLHHPREKTTLYQCVIYLAPGDYHRFHSPAEWKPTHRRHFHGELLSVSPKIAKWLPGLFCLNERAVYVGSWEYGFFSYTAVGATNVGTVKVYYDKTLQTNHPKSTKRCKDVFLGNNIDLKRGDLFGEFRMGSTIVLVFEAPINFNFSILPGDKVKMGQSLGRIGQQKYVDRIQRNVTTSKSS